MGWLQLVGSLKLQVSIAEYSLFYRALLQKRPIIFRSLLIVATPQIFITLTIPLSPTRTSFSRLNIALKWRTRHIPLPEPHRNQIFPRQGRFIKKHKSARACVYMYLSDMHTRIDLCKDKYTSTHIYTHV